MKKIFLLFFIAFSFAINLYSSNVDNALEVKLPNGYTVESNVFITENTSFFTENGEVKANKTNQIVLPVSDSPYTEVVGFYAAVGSFQKGKIKVEKYDNLKIYLDGKETKNNSEIALTTGKHRFLIVFFADGKSEKKVSVNLEGIDAKITTEFRKYIDHNDYIDFWYPYYFTASKDGKNVAVVISKRDKKGKRKVETALFLNGDFSHYLSFEGYKSPVFSSKGDFLILLKKKTIYKLDLKTLVLKKIFESEKSLSDVKLSPDGKIVYFFVSDTYKGKKKDYAVLFHLYEKTPFYKTKTAIFSVGIDGKTIRKVVDPDYIDAFAVDGEKIVYFVSKLIDNYPWAKTEVYTEDLTNLNKRKIGEYNIGSENPVGSVIIDGQSVYFTAQKEEYNEKKPANYYDNALYLLNLKSGEIKPLTKKERFTTGIDIIYAYQTSDTLQKTGNSIAMITTDNGRGEIYLYKLKNGKVKKMNRPANLLTTGFKITESGTFVMASDFNHYPALYLNGKKVFVFEPESLQKRIVLSPYKYFKFKSKTGYEINNYLIYPANYNPDKKYPLIVFYYGGVVPCGNPFHPVFQYLANNGYFVFLTTPRGAVGRGEKFAAEHCNEWGEKSAADIIEATKWICGKVKSIDKEKLGAYSGSYGGFLANTLAYKTNIFKALVSEYGISNIASYWGGGYWGYLYGMTALHGSYPWNAKNVYVNKSPLYNADKVKTPLLLMHGTSDVNVPTLESDQFFTALKVLGKDCVYIRFFNEDHGMKGKFSNWIAQENFLIAWFDKYLKSDGAYWDYLTKKTRGKITHTPFKDYFNYNGEKK